MLDPLLRPPPPAIDPVLTAALARAAAGVAVEVTHRSKRRLFGLAGLASLREVVRPPAVRPDTARSRGRSRLERPDEPVDPIILPLASAPPPIARGQFDYSDPAHWMIRMDLVTRHTRRTPCSLAGAPRRIPGGPRHGRPREDGMLRQRDMTLEGI